MSVFGSKITLFHRFSPKNHWLAQFGQDLCGDHDGDAFVAVRFSDGGDAVAFVSSLFLSYFIV